MYIKITQRTRSAGAYSAKYAQYYLTLRALRSERANIRPSAAEASAEVMSRASQQTTSNDFLDEKRLRFSNTVTVKVLVEIPCFLCMMMKTYKVSYSI